ncbi:MAG: hypothetical protein U9R39_03670 [Campylobacterota bacterium]|nr:hypothetical protein [Campylobacterota bacterium]
MRFIIKDLFLNISENIDYLKSVVPHVDTLLLEINKALNSNINDKEVIKWINNNESLILTIDNYLIKMK